MVPKPNTERIQKQFISVMQKYIARRLTQGITRTDLGKELGISSATLINLINKGGQGVGLESLINMLSRAGGEVNVTITLMHFASEQIYKHN